MTAAAELIADELGQLNNHRHVGEIRQKGLMVGIELVRDRRTMEPFAMPLRVGHQVTVVARRKGLIIRPLGDVIVLMPAPSMPLSLIQRMCALTIEAIEEVVSQFE